MNNTDWNLLKSFLKVVETGSLSKAAVSLKSSQPTIGRHIDQLEMDLGVLLFDRTARGYNITELGMDLVNEVKKMQENAFNISKIIDDKSNILTGTVRISASDTVAFKVLPPIIFKLREKYPQMHFEISSTDEVENLLERKADIALRMVRPNQKDLTTKKVCSLEIGMFVSKKYPRFKEVKKMINGDLKQVLEFDIVGQDNVGEIIDGLSKKGLYCTRENFPIRTDKHLINYSLIEEGLGLGFCLNILAKDNKNLVRLLPHEEIMSIPIWLTAHRELKTNKRMRLIYNELAQILSEQYA